MTATRCSAGAGLSSSADTSEWDEAVRVLQRRIGHVFHKTTLLETALTHSSWAHEKRRKAEHYERLEFLGDSVVGLAISSILLQREHTLSEGSLARTRAGLVSAPALASAARQFGLGPLIRVGAGEERSGGRDRENILADVLEAIVGAAFLDGGFDVAATVVERLLAPLLERLDSNEPMDARDPKSALQLLVQARWQETPEYRLVTTTGPGHDQRFDVEVVVQGRSLATGHGKRKRDAEQEAARKALETLTRDGGENRNSLHGASREEPVPRPAKPIRSR
jgi:ribonuclease-3